MKTKSSELHDKADRAVLADWKYRYKINSK